MKFSHEENGYNIECTHSGQKRAYGDLYKEFTVKADKPEDEVREYCTASVHACGLTNEQYNRDNRDNPSAENHFRSSYTLTKRGYGEYFYRVISPFTD